MKVSSSKESILKKIRQALSNSTPLPFPQSEGTNSVFNPPSQEAAIEFAEQFTHLEGKFVFCLNIQEAALQLKTLIDRNNWANIFCREEKLKTDLRNNNFDHFSDIELGLCDAAVTGCEYLVARTGSIVMSSAQESGRSVSVYAPVHICIAYTNQLVFDVKDALQLLKEKYQSALPSLITFATGPSRTADIEKTLIIGVHGPKEVYVFLIDEQ